MLITIRRHASWLAAAVLLSLLAAVVREALPSHAIDDHDAPRAVLAASHDESAHRWSSDARDTPDHPLHCLVCHWSRAFRPAPDSATHLAPRLVARASLQPLDLPAPATVLPAQLTLRSPPPSSRFVL